MPHDITMCVGQNCPLKENCLRFTGAVYGRWDSFTSAPFNFQTNHCEHYWDDRPSEEKTRDLAYKLWKQDGCRQGKDFEYWLQAQTQLIYNIRNS